MPTASSTAATRKKTIAHGYGQTLNQFETIKPIEVKCFLNDQTLTIETEKKQTDVTATMTTIVPAPPALKRPSSVPVKARAPAPVMDIVVSKPIRHIAVLPSAKEQAQKRLITDPNNLSETFTLYDGPTTTPDLGRSLDENMNMNPEHQQSSVDFGMAPIIEVRINGHQECDTTTVSSVCELIDQPKLQQKPYSLIGRYPSAPPERTTQPNPPVHIATVRYSDEPIPETTNKQVLIQQFYAQLEKMKATFATEPAHQMTTNTLTFDNGQVRQTSATNQLKEKSSAIRTATCTAEHHAHPKPPVSTQPRTKKNSSTRIQSAPITMATRLTTTASTTSKCKIHRPEKKANPPKTTSSAVKCNRRSESAPLVAPVQVELRSSDVTLLPQDEDECRQIYEKLLRLQPDGACADMNTLRRALYPPVGTTTFSSSSPTPILKSSRPRMEEIPHSWTLMGDRYVSPYVAQAISQPPDKLLTTSDQTNIDRIADQMKKHAAINYSYYTRTK